MRIIYYFFCIILIIHFGISKLNAQGILGKIKKKVKEATEVITATQKTNGKQTNTNQTNNSPTVDSSSKQSTANSTPAQAPRKQQSGLSDDYFSDKQAQFIPLPSSVKRFEGYTISYNGKMYMQYIGKDNTNLSSLQEFDGSTFKEIQVRDLFGFSVTPIVFNGKLYMRNHNLVHTSDQPESELYEYDGSHLSVVPLPDINKHLSLTGGSGYQGTPIIYKNKLYFSYRVQSGEAVEFAQFDGKKISIVSLPSTSQGRWTYSPHVSQPILYNDKLYLPVRVDSGGHNSFQMSLVEFDGTHFQLIRNTAQFSGYSGSPIIFQGKLYIKYSSNLARLEGTKISVIPNPDNGEYGGYPIIYNNKLYLSYVDSSKTGYLAEYDGTKLKLIANPDNSNNPNYRDKGISFPFVFNNKLYFWYEDRRQLAEFDGNSISIKPIRAFANSNEPSVVIQHNNKLYLEGTLTLNNRPQRNSLLEYDGTSFKIIRLHNPEQYKEGYITGPVFSLNNKLYFQYMFGDGHLEYAAIEDK